MNYEDEIELNLMINDILENEEFIKLKDENHHGINRLDHVINVTRTTFKFAKKFKWDDIEEVTRAALLHDFFFKEEIGNRNQLIHNKIAIKNAVKYFNINKKQQNIIDAHMFPLCFAIPKYKGSWLVSAADKYCAINECLRHKLPVAIGTLTLFVLNFILIHR